MTVSDVTLKPRPDVSGEGGIAETAIVDFAQLSEWGLLHKINAEILHPLGLSMFRVVDDDPEVPQYSGGATISNSTDFGWSFSQASADLNKAKFEVFLRDRVGILSRLRDAHSDNQQ